MRAGNLELTRLSYPQSYFLVENKKGTGNFLKIRLNSVKGDLSYIDVLAL